MAFVHLHNHSCFSILDAATRIVCAWSRIDSFTGDVTVKILSSDTTTERTMPRPYLRDPLIPFQLT